MKTKSFLAECSVLTLFFVSFVTIKPVQVGAEGEVQGKATTTFKENGEVVSPVDPEEEDDKEIDPTHPPTAGPLSINYVSDIRFGKQSIPAQEQIFYAANDTITQVASKEKKEIPNFVQVTDLRGSASGWTLSVRQNSPFMNEKGELLTGAKLKLSAVSVVSQYGLTNTPTGLIKDQVLSDDGKTFFEIVKAEAGTGTGRWNIYIGSEKDTTDNVSLTVPKNEPKKGGKYTTSLTWLLQDGL